MANYYLNNGSPQKLLNRKERREILKGVVKKPRTVEDMCKKASTNLEIGRKITNAMLEENEKTLLQDEAERNSKSLKHLVETFGNEKGHQMFNKNMDLKNENF